MSKAQRISRFLFIFFAAAWLASPAYADCPISLPVAARGVVT